MTVPKPLCAALGASEGGRLIWQLLLDGTLRVCLKLAHFRTQAAASRAASPRTS